MTTPLYTTDADRLTKAARRIDHANASEQGRYTQAQLLDLFVTQLMRDTPDLSRDDATAMARVRMSKLRAYAGAAPKSAFQRSARARPERKTMKGRR